LHPYRITSLPFSPFLVSITDLSLPLSYTQDQEDEDEGLHHLRSHPSTRTIRQTSPGQQMHPRSRDLQEVLAPVAPSAGGEQAVRSDHVRAVQQRAVSRRGEGAGDEEGLRQVSKQHLQTSKFWEEVAMRATSLRACEIAGSQARFLSLKRRPLTTITGISTLSSKRPCLRTPTSAGAPRLDATPAKSTPKARSSGA